MKRSVILSMLCILLLAGATAFAARPRVVLGPGLGKSGTVPDSSNFRVPFHQNYNLVLSADTVYVLTGWYFVDSTYSITIPAGTIIRGDSVSGGALIIKRGAKIYSYGTKEAPVVFTSNKPAGQRYPSDWGGLILLGAAPTNRPTTQQIEGGFGTPGIPNSDAQYGGSDPNDNSGVVQYTRLEFGGAVYAQDNEINGMTFGGVGAGTTIDHIQVSYANDDDYEWFGGTVRCKYLVSWRNLDDTFDTDFGWSGALQFCYAKRDPLIFDNSASGSSNGWESDNQGTSPYYGDPRTSLRASNITEVGPAKDSTAANALSSKWGVTMMLRRATQLSTYNSVFMGWRNGITLRDTLTQRAAINDTLQIRNTSIAAPRAMLTLTSSPSTGNIAGFDVVSWFKTSGWGNIGDTARQGIDMGFPAAVWNLDPTNNPVPNPGSEAAVAGTSYQGRLAGDAWFDSVSYRGAFDPSLPRDKQWDYGWTNYDPKNYDPELSGSVTVAASWNLLSYPVKGSANPTVAAVFPGATSNAYTYNGGYVELTSVTHGPGYWLKFGSGSTINFTDGYSSKVDTFTLHTGWNIIGSVSSSFPTASLVTTPGGIVTSQFFGYSGAYASATSLEPGQGYWVKANAPGTLVAKTLPASAPKQVNFADALRGLNSLTITDKLGRSQTLYFGADDKSIALDAYELPPAPPSGAFDARFSSQRMVEVGSADQKHVVTIQSAAYPVKVSFSGAGKSIEVLENGVATARRVVPDQGSILVSNATSLVVTTGGATTPKTFALGQNYPNPFNPTTNIAVDVPKEAFVEVAVFNTLGQKVSTLLSGVTAAGTYNLQWNATNSQGFAVPSGTYFIRMSSENFSAVHKMMLMK